MKFQVSIFASLVAVAVLLTWFFSIWSIEPFYMLLVPPTGQPADVMVIYVVYMLIVLSPIIYLALVALNRPNTD